MDIRSTFLNQPKPELTKVHVSSLGIDVYVKPLTIKEQEDWENTILDKDGKPREDVSVKASMVVACTYDSDGNKVFKESDIPELSNQAAKPMVEIFNVCSKVNGLSKEHVEELEGN